ncbi:hypothetical protein BV20DRAFT_273958 [Pilatotrama ljubarskyi]|nr:hypothetical protein BV20DRAFT_273958 [Pilatotrama ljubarskyi]
MPLFSLRSITGTSAQVCSLFTSWFSFDGSSTFTDACRVVPGVTFAHTALSDLLGEGTSGCMRVAPSMSLPPQYCYLHRSGHRLRVVPWRARRAQPRPTGQRSAWTETAIRISGSTQSSAIFYRGLLARTDPLQRLKKPHSCAKMTSQKPPSGQPSRSDSDAGTRSTHGTML